MPRARGGLKVAGAPAAGRQTRARPKRHDALRRQGPAPRSPSGRPYAALHVLQQVPHGSRYR